MVSRGDSASRLGLSKAGSRRKIALKASHRDIPGSPVDKRKMQLSRREEELAHDSKNDAMSPDHSRRIKDDGSMSSLNNKDCRSPAKGSHRSSVNKGPDGFFSPPRHRNPSIQANSNDGFSITAKLMNPNMRGVATDAISKSRQKNDAGREKIFQIKRNVERTSVNMDVLFDKKWTKMIDNNTDGVRDR